MMHMNTPRFEHDGCPRCKFVGQYGAEDVWYCGGSTGPTIMRRSSDEPSDYRSMSPTMAKSLDAKNFTTASAELHLFVKEWRAVLALVEAAILEEKTEEIQ